MSLRRVLVGALWVAAVASVAGCVVGSDGSNTGRSTQSATATCPPEPTTPDKLGQPRNAKGYIRWCWPGEEHCYCDRDNDCYAEEGYVPCTPTPGSDGGAMTDGGATTDGGGTSADGGSSTPCPPEPTTLDSSGQPRNADGYIRWCWPGEPHCYCDRDNDCYAEKGYVACTPPTSGGRVTSVNFTVSPTSGVAGQPSTISATSTGSSTPHYRFWTVTPGGVWRLACGDYAARSTCTFTPDVPGTWQIAVSARDAASSERYEATTGERPYPVTAAPAACPGAIRALTLPSDTVSNTTAPPATTSSWTFCGGARAERVDRYTLRVTDRIGVILDTGAPGTGAAGIALRRNCDDAASEVACADRGDNDGDTYGYWPRLIRVLEPGDYGVLVYGGSYTMTLRTFAPPAQSACATAPELVGAMLPESDTGYGGQGGAACAPAGNRPQSYYRVTVPAGQRAIVTASHGNYDTRLALRAADGCGASSCLTVARTLIDTSAGRPTRLTRIGLDNRGSTTRTYLVSLGAVEREEGDRLFVSAALSAISPTVAPNATCSGATVVGHGTHLSAQNTAHATQSNGACTPDFQGRVLYYRVTVPARSDLVVRVAGVGAQPTAESLRVLDGCGATSCVLEEHRVFGSAPFTRRISNTSTAPREFVLAVGDVYPTPGTTFDLDVTIEPLP